MPLFLWEVHCGLHQKSNFLGAFEVLQEQSMLDIVVSLAVCWWQREEVVG